jgi:rhamnulokinase
VKPLGQFDARARVAIDLGAGSCRVSLLQWREGTPKVELVHRIANDPVHTDGTLRWPLESLLAGLEAGLRKAAECAPEGIASIAVDGWAVDYVRLDAEGKPLAAPFCYRDERTVAAKEKADRLVAPELMFRQTGAQPLRINTVYQLLADGAAGTDAHAPWLNIPEYVLFRLGGRRIAEYTNATHTGLVDIASGGWSDELLRALDLPRDAFPEIVPTGTTIGKLAGPLAELAAFRDTDLIVPACHDTASAIAGIVAPLAHTAYICSGTWSLVGTQIHASVTTPDAMAAGFTNQGAAGGGFCFHTNVNGLWLLNQCMEGWRRQGRPWVIGELVACAAQCTAFRGIVPVDAAPLLLDGDMPSLLNDQLRAFGHEVIKDCAGNEPVFAQVIFESLASRYATVLHSLEQLLGEKFERIHVLGGGSQNRLLTQLTSKHTGLPVETGNVEGSTVGNFAVQLAASEEHGRPLQHKAIRYWAQQLSERVEGRVEPSECH